MHRHGLFLYYVLSHWIAAMSGAISLFIAIYQAFRKRSIESRTYFIVAGLFFFVACDWVWQDEHHNTETLIAEKASLWSERDFWKNQSYDKDASLRGRDELLGKNYGVLAQTQNSLSTLSNRLLDVEKVGPLKIDLMVWKIPAIYTYEGIGKVQLRVIVMISNKFVSPVAGIMTCDAPFRALESNILTHSVSLGLGISQHTPTTVHVDMISPPWSAQNPLVFAVIAPGGGKDIQECSFKLD